MYILNENTNFKFTEKYNITAYQFIDSLSLYEREAILCLMDMEYERGKADNDDEIKRAFDEGYNAGYDDGYHDYEDTLKNQDSHFH